MIDLFQNDYKYYFLHLSSTNFQFVLVTRLDVPDGVVPGDTAEAEGGRHGRVGGGRESGPEADERSDAAHVHQRLLQLVVEVVRLVLGLLLGRQASCNAENDGL